MCGAEGREAQIMDRRWKQIARVAQQNKRISATRRGLIEEISGTRQSRRRSRGFSFLFTLCPPPSIFKSLTATNTLFTFCTVLIHQISMAIRIYSAAADQSKDTGRVHGT